MMGCNKMAFERELKLNEVREQFKQKLIGDGLEPEQAEKSAKLMSQGDVDQVQKDLARHPDVTVINKITGRTIKIKASQFASAQKTSDFLRGLARDNDELYDYLSKYLHQGAFLHLTELLMAYYFAPDTQLRTGNRQAIFTVEEDGSIDFTEKFDVEHIRTSDQNNSTEYQTATGGPIATFSLSSKLKVQNNKIEHSYSNIDVQVHDSAAKKLFEDTRGKFAKFISWVKEAITFLFSSVERMQKKQREGLITPIRKL
jgi:hypothetical protein